MDEFTDDLKGAFENAGFEVMSEQELEDWMVEAEEYRESSEGIAEEAAGDALLKDYLENKAKYKFTKDMGEISGFGGGYEMTCRAMLDAGLQWFDANPNADPKFHGYKNVYGIIQEDNKDAEELTKAVVDASFDDCTGAMVQAVISSCLFIRKNGWDHYTEAMSRKIEIRSIIESKGKDPALSHRASPLTESEIVSPFDYSA